VLSGLKKGDVVIVGPYTTVTKDLNSGDKIIVSSGIEKTEKK
jgi:HlyD family secretion protein